MRRKLVRMRCTQVLLVILGVVTALAMGTPALAANLYEHCNGAVSDHSGVSDVNWGAQTFTPSAAHTVTSVKLMLRKQGAPGAVTVGIRATSGGKPMGGDLCSATIDGSTLPTSLAWHEITLGSGYSLSAGTMYAIVLRAPSGSCGNQLWWAHFGATDPYAGGSRAWSTDSGSNWTTTSGFDMLFEEWGEQQCAATSTGTGTACFSSSAGNMTTVSTVSEGSLPTAGKPNLAFPHGFFSFNITGLTPGQNVTVNITLPSGPTPTQYWKYHPNTQGGWVQIPMTVVSPNVITITLVDGGLGDDDGTALGTIVDQGGPGSPGGGVGWETYPVNRVRVLLPWIALAVVLAAGTGWYIRRRRTAHS